MKKLQKQNVIIESLCTVNKKKLLSVTHYKKTNHTPQHPHTAAMSPRETSSFSVVMVAEATWEKILVDKTVGWAHWAEETVGWTHWAEETVGWTHWAEEIVGWAHWTEKTVGWARWAEETVGWACWAEETVGWARWAEETVGWACWAEETVGCAHWAEETVGWAHWVGAMTSNRLSTFSSSEILSGTVSVECSLT